MVVWSGRTLPCLPITPEPPLLCFLPIFFSFPRGEKPNPLKNSSKGLPLKKSSPNLSQGFIVTVFSVVILTTAGLNLSCNFHKGLAEGSSGDQLVFFSLFSPFVLVSELALSLSIQKKSPKSRTTTGSPEESLANFFEHPPTPSTPVYDNHYSLKAIVKSSVYLSSSPSAWGKTFDGLQGLPQPLPPATVIR